MRKKLIATVLASLFVAGSAWADDNFNWAGSLELGGRGTNTNGGERNGAYGTSSTTLSPFTGPKDGAKAQEYQDPSSGVIGVVNIRGGSKDYYLGVFGENFGRDDQTIYVRGGGYDVFKVQLYNDRIPHNLSFNALTPLNNPGSGFQTAPAGAYPQGTNPATWNSFDYGTQRNTTGGNLEVNAKTPWFIRVDYNEVVNTGVRPSSGQLGTGSSNGLIEFGVPTDTKTRNSIIEAGYKGDTWNIKLSFLDSKFTDSNNTAQWANFYMLSAMDTTIQPPDNDLQKLSLNAAVRDLPLNSTVLVRLTQSKLTNSFDVMAGGLKPTGSQSPPTGVGYLITTPSSPTFDGDQKTTTATFALNSAPMAGLDTRIYYEYYDKENNSTAISYAGGGLGSAAATCPGSNSATRFCVAPLPASTPFEYTKNEFGIDANYRITSRQKLYGGISFLNVDRTLDSAEKTDDSRFWLEYRASTGDDLSGRLKYQYLTRKSDFNHSFTDSGPATPAQVPYYFSAYDVSNFDQNMVKFNADWSPVSMLNIGFGATWRQTDYKDLQYFGRTDDTSQQYDLTISYGDADTFRITGIGNWGEVKFNQAYRNVASGGNPTPSDPQTSTSFDWGSKNTQTNWLVALLADWAATDKLKLTASGSWQKTGGGVDFWSGNTQGAGGYNGGPLVNYVTDNTTMNRYQIKAEYVFNKNWSATAGYWYEKYKYDDDQMRGYQSYYGYFQNLGGTNNSWNSGAFANPSYTNNIFFVTATYRFDK